METIKGGQVFLPYFNNVYKTAYPGLVCIEETVASVWEWDNSVMRSPATLQHYWRQVISWTPGPAYAEAANWDHDGIHDMQNILVAQANVCHPTPPTTPQIWGILPHAYVQPWTRYENVQGMMTQSAGGVLAAQLGGRALCQTMQVYHV